MFKYLGTGEKARWVVTLLVVVFTQYVVQITVQAEAGGDNRIHSQALQVTRHHATKKKNYKK